jgi:hypothetical protein
VEGIQPKKSSQHAPVGWMRVAGFPAQAGNQALCPAANQQAFSSESTCGIEDALAFSM